MASVEGADDREFLARDSLGLSDTGLHRIPGLCDHNGFLASPEKPGSFAGSIHRHSHRHPVLVRQSGRSLYLVVSTALAARHFPTEPGRPTAGPHRSRNRLAPPLGPRDNLAERALD